MGTIYGSGPLTVSWNDWEVRFEMSQDTRNFFSRPRRPCNTDSGHLLAWVSKFDIKTRLILSRRRCGGSTMSEPSTPISTASSHSLSSVETPPLPSTPPNLHQNTIDPDSKWLVQKYGGTSVGKFASQIAENIVPYARISRPRSNSHSNVTVMKSYLPVIT